MGFLDSKEKTLEEKRIDELMKKPLDSSIKGNLKQKLKKMAKEGKSINEIERYYKEIAAKTQFIDERREEYVTEAKLADKVYKAYITDGLSRLDKINGRFLASQSIKTDILIEQNNRIIQLLETIVTNMDDTNMLTAVFCSECGAENVDKAQFCKECGIKI